MSEEHVAAVFGPAWARDSLVFERERIRSAEQAIKALRLRLCQLDPSLPHYLDGSAWHTYEQEWLA